MLSARDERVDDDEPANPAPSQPLPTALVMEAIARGLCVNATYNKQRMLLAPHIVFTKHGDLFIDAVTLERDGQKPKELKLGTFKLVGLSALELTDRSFFPSELYVPGLDRYRGETVFAVQL